MIQRYALSAGIVLLLGAAACGGGGGGGPNPNFSCAQSCAGCCQNGVCQPGSASNACGSDGDTCVSCGKYGQCTNATCMLDLSRTATLRVAYMKFTSTNGASDWDGDGSPPDPYVTVNIGGVSKSSGYVQNPSNLTANLNYTFGTFTIGQLSSEWTFEAFDDDATVDDVMVRCKVFMDPDDLERGYAVWSCGNTITEIRFDLL